MIEKQMNEWWSGTLEERDFSNKCVCVYIKTSITTKRFRTSCENTLYGLVWFWQVTDRLTPSLVLLLRSASIIHCGWFHQEFYKKKKRNYQRKKKNGRRRRWWKKRGSPTLLRPTPKLTRCCCCLACLSFTHWLAAIVYSSVVTCMYLLCLSLSSFLFFIFSPSSSFRLYLFVIESETLKEEEEDHCVHFRVRGVGWWMVTGVHWRE